MANWQYDEGQGAAVTTTDNTQTQIAQFSAGFIQNDSSGVMQVTVVARAQASSNQRTWVFDVAFRKDGSGNMSIMGGLTTLFDQGSLGAVLWAVAVTGNSGGLQVMATGPNSASVDWGARFQVHWLAQ